jgi:hypothetical protein
MREHRIVRIAALLMVFCLAATVALAFPPERPPHRYNPRSLDGALVSVENPVDGTVWSAWAYRDGAQYDIAISFQDATGAWSEPTFLGRDDRDQVQPALAVDPAGNLYLAYTDRGTGQVMVSGKMVGTQTWLPAFAVTLENQRGHRPSLLVVGDRLVVGFRSGSAVVLRDLPLLPPTPLFGHTIEDGPDPFGTDAGGGGAGGSSGGDSGGGSGSDSGGQTGSADGGVWPVGRGTKAPWE